MERDEGGMPHEEFVAHYVPTIRLIGLLMHPQRHNPLWNELVEQTRFECINFLQLQKFESPSEMLDDWVDSIKQTFVQGFNLSEEETTWEVIGKRFDATKPYIREN